MKARKNIVPLVLGLALTGAASLVAGCTAVDRTPVTARSGVQLWADNCQRCHNVRSPGALSDAQWAVAMQHMRVRGNLTAVEHERILEFLQSTN